MRKFILYLLCICLLLLNFVGCADNEIEVDDEATEITETIEEDKVEEIDEEEKEPELKTQKLSLSNYRTFLNFSIIQEEQNSVLIRHRYYVSVYYSATKVDGYYFYGTQPPERPSNAIKISYNIVSSEYTITTNFLLKSMSSKNQYIFNGVVLEGSYKDVKFTLLINDNGKGETSFMISEKVNSVAKSYNLQINDLNLSKITGEVQYYE